MIVATPVVHGRRRQLIFSRNVSLPGIFPVGLFFLMGAPASAGPNYQAAIALHIADATTKNACQPDIRAGTLRMQQPVLSTPAGPFYFVYLVACGGSDTAGIGGLECGIDYDGNYAPAGGVSPISVFDWILCADLEFPSAGWPEPGTGSLMTWTRFNCHHPDEAPVPNTELAVAGYFYLAAYASGSLRVIPRPASGRLKVASCAAFEDDLTDLPGKRGQAGFGSAFGFNSCHVAIPTRPTTWSSIKALGMS